MLWMNRSTVDTGPTADYQQYLHAGIYWRDEEAIMFYDRAMVKHVSQVTTTVQ
jgi:hypothetical protein